MPNTTCPVLEAPVDPVPFYSGGSVNFKAHDVGWIICGFFTLVASGASFWLVWKHLTYYTCPQQQRHIVRMLFMVPIYAIVSTLSYVFFREAIYYQTIRDCYEAVVITSFFNLLLQYVGDTPAEQQEVFRQVQLKKWFFPLNYWKYRPDGLHFLWLMKICILQYAIVRPVCTLAAVGLQYFGLYCLESWEPVFGHIWISLAISISVSVAMFCVIQFYLPIQEELKPYAPVLKFFAVKSVVFLTFWQDSFLSILVYFGAIKQSKYMTAADIQVGINALLETFEMVLFGFIHIKAFTYLIYRPQDRQRTTRRGRALLDVLDFRDWWYDMRNTTRYVKARSRGKDFTVVDDIRREKYQHLEKALGRERWTHLQAERQIGKQKLPTFWKDDGKSVEESDFLITISDLEKSLEVQSQDDDQVERKPKGNFAMRADYDPENDEGELEEEPLVEKAKGLKVHRSKIEPRLPALLYNCNDAESPQDTHPELTQYHLTKANDDEDEHGIENDEIFIPRKGGRARKEASLGLGAWWRTFRERVSGGGTEEVGKEREGDEEEKRVMLADELGRGITLLSAEKTFDDDDEMGGELMPPPTRKESNQSSGSSDASASVLRSRDSPLSLIINEHRGERLRGPEEAMCSPKIMPSSREKQVAIVKEREIMARHGSTKIAMDIVEDDSRSQSLQSNQPLVQESSSTTAKKRIGQVEMMSRAMNSVTLQAPQIRSVVPSISGNQSVTAASDRSTSMSTSQLQRQRTQPNQSPNVMKVTGPKGKAIPLVLPTPLSPSDYPPTLPAPIPAPIVSQSTISIAPPSSTSSGAARQSMSKIRFAEVKPIDRRRRDDPEAEPIQVAGTVIVGAQSLSQVNAMKKQREAEQMRQRQQGNGQQRGIEQQQQQSSQTEQMRRKEAEQQRQRAEERSRQSRQQHQPEQSRQGEGSRIRRSSEPVQRQQQQQSKHTSQQSKLQQQSGKKGRTDEPYISLPAPSQLAHMGNRQDPFAAAVIAVSSNSNNGSQGRPLEGTPNLAGRGTNSQQRKRSAEGGGRRHSGQASFEVGAIVSRQDVINATNPGPADSYRQYPSQHRGLPIRQYSTPVQSRLIAPPRPQAAANPQHHPHYHHESTRRPIRHSIGSASRPVAVASYDRYSGEPAWIQDGQASSRVESRRRQYEAPEGFQFDYID